MRQWPIGDGGAPVAPPVEGIDGNFYGTTLGGPHSLNGTIFKITPDGALTPLYSFTGTSDGGGPRWPSPSFCLSSFSLAC